MRKYWVVCLDENGEPVLPFDCNEPEYEGKTADAGMLVYLTKAGAEASVRHQNGMYFLECHVRRLGEETRKLGSHHARGDHLTLLKERDTEF